ncbi:hypothetical protein OBBRIDRAFT_831637 [Obba rivulosa]|uniref:Uncharacterized protein n=1 Tax=Obba rivulosa TaxID=1052685 RepID=A0A8E2DRP4_9APHY|nr:hypothetical protein OBBRIDRAFT_831637 [Obba rivulosa]
MAETVAAQRRYSGDKSSRNPVKAPLIADIDLASIDVFIKSAAHAARILSWEVPECLAVARQLPTSSKAVALKARVEEAQDATYQANEASLNALFIVRMACYLLMLLTREKLGGGHIEFFSSRFTYSDVVLQMSRYMTMCVGAYTKLETCAKMWEEVAVLSSKFRPFTPRFVARLGLDLGDALGIEPGLDSVVKVDVADYAKHFAVLVCAIRGELEAVEAFILRCEGHIKSPEFNLTSILDQEHVLVWGRLERSWEYYLSRASAANDLMVLKQEMYELDFIREAREEAFGNQTSGGENSFF